MGFGFGGRGRRKTRERERTRGKRERERREGVKKGRERFVSVKTKIEKETLGRAHLEVSLRRRSGGRRARFSMRIPKLH